MLVIWTLLVTLVFTFVVRIVMSVTGIDATGLDTNLQGWIAFVIGLVLTFGTFIFIGQRGSSRPPTVPLALRARRASHSGLPPGLPPNAWVYRDPEQTLQTMDKNISLDPKDPVGYSNRGSLYAQLGQHQRAIQDYNESIRLDPQYALVYYQRAFAYHALGQMQRANQDFEEAIRLNPVYRDGTFI